MTHPALSSLNPFNFGRCVFSSLPSGESEPAVTLAWAPAENRFHPDMAALAVWLDEPPLFLRTRPTIRYADESRDFLAWFRVFFER